MRRSRGPWFALREALSVMDRPAIWAPLFLYTVFKILVMFLYRGTAIGPVSVLWRLLISPGHWNNFGHYPWDLIYMPGILARATIALDVFVGALFEGATIILFADVFRQKPLSVTRSLRLARHSYWHLVGVTVAVYALAYGGMGIPRILARLVSIALPSKLFALTDVVISLTVHAFFVYAIPLVLLARLGVLDALGRSLAWSVRSFMYSLVLVGLPFLMTAPAILISAQSRMFVSRFSPEVLLILQVVNEVVTGFSLLLLGGAIASAFLRRRTYEKVD